jgi:sialic acid synthase SpsE/mannose-6-phosphate isomerase-like protein (cupin superfamily)
MSNIFQKPLFIFEMANNHMGDVNHGLLIINQFSKFVNEFKDFSFGFKFQYRNLNTFIHPEFKERTEYKYVKRFLETRLSEKEFLTLKKEAQNLGFITICTAFDEFSVEKVINHGYQIIKIASCSLTDWPLLEKIQTVNIPILGSCGGVPIEEIDKVVSFFEHRQKEFVLMHCVGLYPTSNELLELNQIDYFKTRYPNIKIGFSSHEHPDNLDAIKIAIAKGASVFERHVGIPTSQYKINAYSSTPEQIYKWLLSAQTAFNICGIKGNQRKISLLEAEEINALKRGIFAKTKIKAGETISQENIFFAIPSQKNQLFANDFSKYAKIIACKDIFTNQPILKTDVNITNSREKVLNIIKQIKELVIKSGLKIQNKIDFEISHHYGIDKFYEYGCTIINIINREYCKKLILLLAGQKHPAHKHKIKEETFHVLYGECWININGKQKNYFAGDIVTIERNTLHSFGSKEGAIIEEISTTHEKDDSYYQDTSITAQKNRKTYMTFWIDWLAKPIT